VEVKNDDRGRPLSATLKADGQPVVIGGIEKMAKSKNNGVDPQSLIDQYGADTARMFMMFAAPPEQSLEWNDSGVEGAHRFLKRLWNFAFEHKRNIERALDEKHLWDEFKKNMHPEQKQVWGEINEVLQQALQDFNKYQFNTVVAAGMKIMNSVSAVVKVVEQDTGPSANTRDMIIAESLGILLRLLSPIAPHITHSLWRELGYGEDILQAPWPQVDKAALVKDSIEMVVQVNGKLRAKMQVPAAADKQAIEKMALENDNVQAHIADKTIRKVIVVPGRLVNLVVG
jgi:leucyl-tRNA synthetase